jgi:hypothetical protein
MVDDSFFSLPLFKLELNPQSPKQLVTHLPETKRKKYLKLNEVN